MKETLYLKGTELKEIKKYNFPGLQEALKMSPLEVIQEVKKSGLKGRGGAGFPTGLKWELAAQQQKEQKFFICNGDEGEPGTFKDRYLMESRPLKVLEGIIIGAYAVGASQGYIYIRGEYTTAIKIFSHLLEEARSTGVLGVNIFGSDFSFKLQLVKGAGAYVCGDETSLINSIEGKRGSSRIKPPYPIEQGLRNLPTVVNNVETLAAVAEILGQGAASYAQLGTEQSRGTKLVCLSGDINQPGIYELEFGSTTLEEIIAELGGGIRDNRRLKFVIPGGISTTIMSAGGLNIKYTYEDLQNAGSSLGSGAVIVVGEGHNLIDLMLNVARFFMDETCGTCFPCREGNRQIYHLLKEHQVEGKISPEEKKIISDIGRTIHLAARCGLGQTSLNFVESVMNQFGSELIAGGDELC